MWLTNYIDEIKRQFITVYGYPENPEMPGVPLPGVPDGEYPMTIEGKVDHVKITNGNISCCIFNQEVKS